MSECLLDDLYRLPPIKQAGAHRLWYDCWPRADIGTPRMGNFNLVRYAESEDGMDWKLPKLDLVEYEGTPD